MGYVKGEVKYRLYSDASSSFSIYKILIDETDEPLLEFHKNISVLGYFEGVEIGNTFMFHGEVTENKKYGYSFKCQTYERVLPTSKIGLIEFLSGDMFKGIGAKTATDVVETLGTDCIKKILESPDSLDAVPKMDEKKKEVLYTVLKENKELEEILVKLYSYGISPKFSLRIYDKYKNETLNVIAKDPYKLIDDIDGIAFLKADKIALESGINPRSEGRCEACIAYTLYTYSNETGNTYMDKETLKKKTFDYLQLDQSGDELVERCLSNLKFKGKLVEIDETYSDYRVYRAEKFVSRKLHELNRMGKPNQSEEEIIKVIERLEDSLNIQYEDEQIDAIVTALTNNVSVITGGPGTGKTTIERGIIYCYNQLIEGNMDVINLCAPTGKAAKRIEESTRYKATTIHKLLGYDRSGEYFYNKLNFLPSKLIVVDEASMIDVFLFERLLEAVNYDCKIVIVGDSDQLPSIGPGQVLKDLIDSNHFSVVKLNKIHRQKKNSKIISLAYDILAEEIKTEIDPDHKELSFIRCEQGDLQNVLKFVIDRFMGLGYKLETDIQVLIPMYKGIVGIEAMNKYLQYAFNKNTPVEMEYGGTTFYPDDKVIQLVNQYEDSVMNGDMGVVSDTLGKKELTVDFQGNQVTYKGQDIQNVSLAYAISIHKSQGSEFPCVILPIFPSYNVMLNKKLLYTAVTRAKDYLVLVGDARTLSRSIRVLSEDRRTRVKDILNEL